MKLMTELHPVLQRFADRLAIGVLEHSADGDAVSKFGDFRCRGA